MTMICNDKNTSKVTLTLTKHYKKEEEKERSALVDDELMLNVLRCQLTY